MTDLKNGIIELFSHEIYIGMHYKTVIERLAMNVDVDTLNNSGKDYGYIFTKKTPLMGLKAAECRLFFSELKLEEISFIVNPSFDEYIESISRDKLTREFYYELVEKLFEGCIEYVNENLIPTKKVNVNSKRMDYFFDNFIMSIVMEQGNETFSISMGRCNE